MKQNQLKMKVKTFFIQKKHFKTSFKLGESRRFTLPTHRFRIKNFKQMSNNILLYFQASRILLSKAVQFILFSSEQKCLVVQNFKLLICIRVSIAMVQYYRDGRNASDMFDLHAYLCPCSYWYDIGSCRRCQLQIEMHRRYFVG